MWLPRTSRSARARRGLFRHGVDAGHPRTGRVDDEARLDAAFWPALVELDRIAIGERGDRSHGAAVADVGAAGAGVEQDGKR